MIVDSNPASVAPSSRINGTFPPRLLATCAAVVGEIPPLALAEGAAKGRPDAAINPCIARCRGTRTAIVANPAVTSEAIPESPLTGSTNVNGPGQNAAASARASASNTAIRSAAARSATCTISGLKLGRPLAA